MLKLLLIAFTYFLVKLLAIFLDLIPTNLAENIS